MPAKESLAPDSDLNALLSSNSFDSVDKTILKHEFDNEKKVSDFADKKMSEMDAMVKPERPKMPEAPKAENYNTSPMETFGSGAMMLATIGSLFTRKSLTNSLNSAAAVNNAVSAKDTSAYKNAYDKWKQDTDYAFKLSEWDLNNYKDALAEGDHAVSAYAAAHKNPAAMDALKMKMDKEHYRDLMSNYKKSKDSFDLVKDHADQAYEQAISEGKSEDEARMAQMKAFGEGKAAMTGKSSSGASLDQDALNEMTDEYLAGNKSVVSGLGYGQAGAANRAALRENIAKKMKEQGMSGADIATKMAEYQGQISGERTIAQRGANVSIFSNEAKNMGKQLRKASSEFNRSDFVPLANGEISVDVATNNPKADRYNAAINTYINAYAKAVNGGGQALLADKEHARDVLFKGMDDKALDATLDILDKEMNSAISAAKQAKSGLAGRKAAGTKDEPMELPDDGEFEKGKYYINDQGDVGEYTGEKNGQHVFE